jgi:hypothetical protein
MTKKESLYILLPLIFFVVGVFFLRWEDYSPVPTHPTPSPLSPSLLESPSPLVPLFPSPSPIETISHRMFTSPANPFNQKIPTGASYTKESRIGSVRPAQEEYSMPIYQVNSAEIPSIKVFNDYGRTENWPIPLSAQPDTGSDHRMGILDTNKQVIYEIWDAQWRDNNTLHAGGMKDFPLKGDGMSHPANQRVNAAGWAASAGMFTSADFGTDREVSHALMVSLPHALLKKDAFISPAQGGEAHGDNTGDLPLGTRLALPKNIDVDSLNVSPFTKILTKQLRDYGAFVSDRNSAAKYKDQYVATFQIEQGLPKKIYNTSNNNLSQKVQTEMYGVIQKYGLYRVN